MKKQANTKKKFFFGSVVGSQKPRWKNRNDFSYCFARPRRGASGRYDLPPRGVEKIEDFFYEAAPPCKKLCFLLKGWVRQNLTLSGSQKPRWKNRNDFSYCFARPRRGASGRYDLHPRGVEKIEDFFTKQLPRGSLKNRRFFLRSRLPPRGNLL